MSWRPIETAPKDGTHILVPYPVYAEGSNANPKRYEVLKVFWHFNGWDTGVWRLHETPACWMPLPAPPTAPPIAGTVADPSTAAASQLATGEPKSQNTCKCSLSTKLVGDGCAICNPKIGGEK